MMIVVVTVEKAGDIRREDGSGVGDGDRIACPSACLSCLSVCLSICLPACWSISVYLPARLPACLSDELFISAYLSVVGPPVCLPIDLLVRRYVHHACLFACPG